MNEIKIFCPIMKEECMIGECAWFIKDKCSIYIIAKKLNEAQQ